MYPWYLRCFFVAVFAICCAMKRPFQRWVFHYDRVSGCWDIVCWSQGRTLVSSYAKEVSLERVKIRAQALAAACRLVSLVCRARGKAERSWILRSFVVCARLWRHIATKKAEEGSSLLLWLVSGAWLFFFPVCPSLLWPLNLLTPLTIFHLSVRFRTISVQSWKTWKGRRKWFFERVQDDMKYLYKENTCQDHDPVYLEVYTQVCCRLPCVQRTCSSPLREWEIWRRNVNDCCGECAELVHVAKWASLQEMHSRIMNVIVVFGESAQTTQVNGSRSTVFMLRSARNICSKEEEKECWSNVSIKTRQGGALLC